MSIDRQPLPVPERRQQEAFRRIYDINARGNSFGTAISEGERAGNMDAIYATVSFGSSAAAAQSVSTTHNLGRAPIGFEVVQRDGPIQMYSDTANLWNTGEIYFSAIVWGAATQNNVTVRIW